MGRRPCACFGGTFDEGGLKASKGGGGFESFEGEGRRGFVLPFEAFKASKASKGEDKGSFEGFECKIQGSFPNQSGVHQNMMINKVQTISHNVAGSSRVQSLGLSLLLWLIEQSRLEPMGT